MTQATSMERDQILSIETEPDASETRTPSEGERSTIPEATPDLSICATKTDLVAQPMTFLERIIAETQPIGGILASKPASTGRVKLDDVHHTTELTSTETELISSNERKSDDPGTSIASSTTTIVTQLPSEDLYAVEAQRDVQHKIRPSEGGTHPNVEVATGPAIRETKTDLVSQPTAALGRVMVETQRIGSILASKPVSTDRVKLEDVQQTAEPTPTEIELFSSNERKPDERETSTASNTTTIVTELPSEDLYAVEAQRDVQHKIRPSEGGTHPNVEVATDPTIRETKTDLVSEPKSFLERIIAETKPIGGVLASEPTLNDGVELEDFEDTAQATSMEGERVLSIERKPDERERGTPSSIEINVTELSSQDRYAAETQKDVQDKSASSEGERSTILDETACVATGEAEPNLDMDPKYFLKNIIAETKPIGSIRIAEPTSTHRAKVVPTKDSKGTTLDEDESISSTEMNPGGIEKELPRTIRTIVRVVPLTELEVNETQDDYVDEDARNELQENLILEPTADPITIGKQLHMGSRPKSSLEEIIAETLPIGSIYRGKPILTQKAEHHVIKDTTEVSSKKYEQVSPIEIKYDGRKSETPLNIKTMVSEPPASDHSVTKTQHDIGGKEAPADLEKKFTLEATADPFTFETIPDMVSQPKTYLERIIAETMPLGRILTPEIKVPYSVEEESVSGTVKAVEERADDISFPEWKPDATSKEILTVATTIDTTVPMIGLSACSAKHDVVEDDASNKKEAIMKALTTDDGSAEKKKEHLIDQEGLFERKTVVKSVAIADVLDGEETQDAKDKQKAVEVETIVKTVRIADPFIHKMSPSTSGSHAMDKDASLDVTRTETTVPIVDVLTSEIDHDAMSTSKLDDVKTIVRTVAIPDEATPETKQIMIDDDKKLNVETTLKTAPILSASTSEIKSDLMANEKYTDVKPILTNVAIKDVTDLETTHTLVDNGKSLQKKTIMKIVSDTDASALEQEDHWIDKDKPVEDKTVSMQNLWPFETNHDAIDKKTSAAVNTKATMVPIEDVVAPETKHDAVDMNKFVENTTTGTLIPALHLSLPETKDNVTMKTVTKTLEFDQPNINDSVIRIKSDSLNAGETAAHAETTTRTPKTEERFHLPTMPSFDTAIHAIKGSLGLEEVKPEDVPKRRRSLSLNEEQTTVVPETTTLTSKKEGGLHLPTMPSFDTAIHAIKESLGLEEVKPEDVPKRRRSLSLNEEQTTVVHETTTLTSKKEGGLHLPAMPSFDIAMHAIKGSLGLEDVKPEDVPERRRSLSLNEEQASVEPETTMTTSKKEGRFHLPAMPSFDTAIHAIKGSLGLEDVKPEDVPERRRSLSLNEEQASVEPETTMSTSK
ncbi:unnamed protein product, partial [Rotaria sp. Silwood2]